MDIIPFNVEIINECGYNRLHIKNHAYTGRIRKHLGKMPDEMLDSIQFHLKYDLEKHFSQHPITKDSVEYYVEQYISMRIKKSGSIFDFFEEFIEFKQNTTNKRTKKKLVKATVTSYRTAKNHFEMYLSVGKVRPHPSQINKQVLDDFYHYIDGIHNYKVKMHNRLKAFLKYLDRKIHLPMDQTFYDSVFSEQYDHIEPDDDDISLTVSEVHMLIALKEKFDKGIFNIKPFTRYYKLPLELQEKQFKVKKNNMKLTLDCFLFMIGTGQYFADIRKSKLGFYLINNTKFIKYRRAKCGSLCKSIPAENDDIFITKQIIEEYKIRPGTNFPLNLSLTHFGNHLERISDTLKFDFKLKNKMARKTFTTIIYYDKKMPISILQILLGHQNVNDTLHYLRLDDDNSANQAKNYMFPEK